MAGTQEKETRIASCPCGAVTLELAGKPIVAATCYCQSCQQAGQAFGALPGAPGVVDADGGTPYLLVRKDRIAWISGTGQLDAHRLKADSPTPALRRAMLQRADRVGIHQGPLAERLCGAHRRGGGGRRPRCER